MKLKNFLLCITLFLFAGCQQNYRKQKQPEVLFENIYIGDNVETCLANGTVQINPDCNVNTLAPKFNNYMFELANNNIANSNFTYT